MLPRVIAVAALFGFTAASPLIAGPVSVVPANDVKAANYDPTQHWEFDLESGIIWRIGHAATPLNYTVLVQELTFKSPAVFSFKVGGGDLVLRNRLSILAEPIIVGPEHYYFGASGSGSLEWWNASRSFSAFLSAGGGYGYMDSKGHQIAGGQGRDFNFNWFVYSGLRFGIGEKMSATIGALFQHISNRGTNEINPGLNALGPMAGIEWHF